MTDRPFLDVEAMGCCVRIGFAADVRPGLPQAVGRAWQGAVVTGREPDATVEVPDGDPPAVLEWLSTEVTLRASECQLPRLLMFHAAGVALLDGRVLGFVGPSGRGKTTLSAALARHYGYVSDEAVAVGDDLTVHPHRKPLSVLGAGGRKQQVSPAEADLLDLPAGPLRLARLVLLERHAELVEPYVEPVSLLDALPGLATEISYFAQRPGPLRRLAEVCTRTGGVLRLHYADADGVLPLLPALLDDREPEPWRPIGPVASGDPGRAEVIDAVAAGGRLAVLVGKDLLVLDGIGPLVWEKARRGVGLDAVTSAVVAAFGEPPTGDATALVASVIGELTSLGALP